MQSSKQQEQQQEQQQQRSNISMSSCRSCRLGGGSRRAATATVLMVFQTILFLSINTVFVVVNAQFNEPPGERREQTYRVLEFENSNINQRYPGTLRYYCTFRGKWSEERHPIDFPHSASWSGPVVISHSNGYRMWTGTEAVTAGIESIAEVRTNIIDVGFVCVCVCVCCILSVPVRVCGFTLFHTHTLSLLSLSCRKDLLLL
jgi:hypothetical protein